MAERLTTTSDKGGLAFTFDLDITCSKGELLKIIDLGKRLKAYEDLGTVEELAALVDASRWIPVSERLPDNNTRVLVLCKNDSVFVADMHYGYENEIVWLTKGPLGTGRRIATERICHWRPLPAGPKKEGA